MVSPTAGRDLLSDPGPDILTEWLGFFRSSGAYIMEGRVLRIAAAKPPLQCGYLEKGSERSRSREVPFLPWIRERDLSLSIKGMRRGFLPLNTSSLQLWIHLAFLGKSLFRKSFNHALLNIFLFPYLLLSFPGQGRGTEHETCS